MKIEDVSGLKRRASMAEQLANEIAMLRCMIELINRDSFLEIKAFEDGADGLEIILNTVKAEPYGRVVRNGNPTTLRPIILAAVQSELRSRLAALEAL